MVRLNNLLAALSLTASVLGLDGSYGLGSGAGSSPAAGLGGLGASKPDSKIARNVLEGKAEGYCSVSWLVICPLDLAASCVFRRYAAAWIERQDVLRVPKSGCTGCEPLASAPRREVYVGTGTKELGHGRWLLCA